MIQIYLPKGIENVFASLCREKNKSIEEIAYEVLCEYAEDVEDYKAGVEGYIDYLESGKKGISLDQLKKELGFSDDKH